MRVVGVQHDIAWEDGAATQERLRARLGEAVERHGADLVVLTEMFPTGFSMAPERIAQPPDGPAATFLREQAADLGAWVCGSIAVDDPALPKPVNRLVLAGPDGEQHTYDKIHPFSYGGEPDHYGAGDRFLTVDVRGARCSFFVCYDLRFGDEFWALANDTDCYVVVANWPEARRLHWQTLLQARAIENLAYVVGVNRVGEGGGLRYTGDSRIIDPVGRILAGEEHVEALLVGDVDPAEVQRVRGKFGFLHDRRASVGSGATVTAGGPT